MSKQIRKFDPVVENKPEVIVTYKGFDAELKCRGFQYEIGATYTHDGVVSVCESGFHGCENPLDVWTYYGPFDSRFAVVEQFGEIARHSQDSKIVSASIAIKTEIPFGEFVRHAVQWVIDHCSENVKDGGKLATSGYCAKLATSGDRAKLAASGDRAKLATSGGCAKLATSGDYAQLAASGDRAQLAASGDSAKLAASGSYAQLATSGNYAQLATSGDRAKLATSGDYAQLVTSGNYAQLAASGDRAQLAASGEHSVIASSARNAVARGAVGTWISLAEYDADVKCVGFATGCVGKDGLEPDVYYRADGGKLVKVIVGAIE